jgi:DHA1 family inner membrane transport protein
MTATSVPGNWIVPVGALLVATFAICTAELLIAGLLPALATDLAVSIPTAGQLITGYAIGVGVLGPILSLLTGRVPRKILLLGVMAVYIVGNVLCALSTNYWTLMGARMVLAACHGLHFGVAIVVATQLAPPGRQASAISVVIAGVSAAIILGVPMGTAIGNAYGWRIAFWAAAAIGVFALLILAWLVPPTGRQEAQGSDVQPQLRAAVRPVALLCYAILALLLLTVFTIGSYVVPLLTQVSGVQLSVVPLVLLGMGVASFIGTVLGGRLGDIAPAATMIVGFAIQIVLAALLSQLSANGLVVAILLFLIWMAGFSVVSSLQGRLQREVKDAPNFASTLMNTASQVGVAAGAALGGLVITWGWSYGQLPLLSAIFAALALAGTVLLVMFDRRRNPALA